jgi:hypothetical protein
MIENPTYRRANRIAKSRGYCVAITMSAHNPEAAIRVCSTARGAEAQYSEIEALAAHFPSVRYNLNYSALGICLNIEPC